MEREPLISIVLPTYNGERYIASSIESCLNQTYKNFELIIVDDNSTDNTATIINEYLKNDSRVKVIRHETNKKLPAALNTGFSLANGDFLTWTSDDNIYMKNALAVLLQTLLDDSSIDIAYSDCLDIDEENEPIEVFRFAKADELPINNCIGPCFLYRRIVQETLKGYREEYFLSEDYDFWIRAYYQFKFKKINRVLYLYRRHQGSLTSSKQKDIYSIAYKITSENLEKMTWIDSNIKARAYLKLVRLSERLDRRDLAIRNYFKAFINSPLRAFKCSKNLKAYVFLGNKVK